MNRVVILVVMIPAILGIIDDEISLLNDLSFEDVTEIRRLNTLAKQSGKDLRTLVKPSLRLFTEDQVKFYVYNRQNSNPQEVLLNQAKQITTYSSFDLTLDTVFIIHGWTNTIDSPINVLLTNGYLQVRNVNVVRVYWDILAYLDYVSSWGAVPFVGACVGQFIGNISEAFNYSLENVYLVGHSLGAHIAGFAGKETKGAIGYIVGLDPAYFLYDQNQPSRRLSQNDSLYVLAIHTDIGVLGEPFPIAVADFYANGGSNQPGCPLNDYCSHIRAYELFSASLFTNQFIAKECGSYVDYLNKVCKRAPPTIMGGAYLTPTIRGIFYLKTSATYPYALGDVGL